MDVLFEIEGLFGARSAARRSTEADEAFSELLEEIRDDDSGEVSLNRKNLTVQKLKDVEEAVLSNSSIVTLDLSDNPHLGDACYSIILNLLLRHRGLRKINLSGCGIGNRCAMGWIRALAETRKSFQLVLNQNPITPRFKEKLLLSARSNRNLVVQVDQSIAPVKKEIKHKEQRVVDKPMKAILGALQDDQLATLSLVGCNFDVSELQTFFLCLSENRSLENAEFVFNAITSFQIKSIALMLRHQPFLKRLLVSKSVAVQAGAAAAAAENKQAAPPAVQEEKAQEATNKVAFVRCNLTVADLLVIQESLLENPLIEELDLSFNPELGDNCFSHIRELLVRHPKLRRVNLTGCGIGNWCVIEWAKAVQAARRKVELILDGNPISESVSREVLSAQGMTIQVANAIPPEKKKIHYVGQVVKGKQLDEILLALQNDQLTQLSLVKCELAENDWIRLFDVMAQSRSLRFLDLSACGLTDKHLECLMKGLQHHNALVELRLYSNKMTDKGVESLGLLATTHLNLSTVELLGNPDVRQETIFELHKKLKLAKEQKEGQGVASKSAISPDDKFPHQFALFAGVMTSEQYFGDALKIQPASAASAAAPPAPAAASKAGK